MSDFRDRVKELRKVPAKELLANPKNWRKHPEKQRRALRAVLQEVGFAGALLAREEDGKLLLIDGHLRTEINPESILPVLVLDVTREEGDKILASYDPISAMASADMDAFKGLVSTMDFETGDFSDLVKSIGGITGARENEDDVPVAPVAPVSRPGDLWILGDHRLLCGDSTSAADVARVLDGAQPGLMVTDPPYGIELDTEWRDRAGLNGHGPAEPSYMKKRTAGHNETSISGDTRADWSDAFALVPSLQVAYVWHASKFTREVLDGLLKIGFLHHQQIIWDKGRTVLTRTHYLFQHEPCWYVRKKNAPWFGVAGENSTIWNAASPKFIMGGSKEEKFDHPTQKPAELMRKSILNHTKSGELVYEPFSGSGTTIIAAEQTGRACRAIELDPKYVDVDVMRWESFTGRKALLDGKTLDEVRAERAEAAAAPA